MSRAVRGERRERSVEDGFTLIELMVVVLIIGILVAIAIPSFAGARQRASDRAAQSNLRNALTAEKTLFTDGQSYTASTAGAGISALSAVEPALNWVSLPPAGDRDVQATALQGNSPTVGFPSEVILAAKSATGVCFYLADEGLTGPATTPGWYVAASASCTAPAALWGTSPPLTGSRADPATGAWAASW